MRAVTMISMPGEGSVEPWVIIVPIILSLLALAILGSVLYAVRKPISTDLGMIIRTAAM